MAKKEPKGLGIWIAFGSMIPGGIDGIIKQCKELGFSVIFPRLGEGAKIGETAIRDHWYTPERSKELCKKAHENNILVMPWIFNRTNAMNGEIELYKKCIAEGADGLMLDAEVPYNNKKAESQIFVDLLKKNFPDTYIANAPFSLIEWHKDYPYKEFGQLDAAMDQLYIREFSNLGPKYYTSRADPMWGKFIKENPGTAKRLPIFDSYGSELAKKWGMKKGPPGIFKIEDTKYLMDHYKELPFLSFYSLEAMHEDLYKFLKERNDVLKASEKNDITPTTPMALMPVDDRPTPAESPDAKALANPELPIAEINPDDEETTLIIRHAVPLSTKPEGIVLPQKPSIFEVIWAFLKQLIEMFAKKK